jgi:heat shock protein HslJ
MTLMACDALDAENVFLQALNGTRGYRNEGEDLVLIGKDGSESRFSADLAQTTPATPVVG